MEKFTEGEWEVANGLLVGEQVLFLHVFGERVLCRLTKQVETTPLTEEDVANAHLMKTAPKMYRMLKELADNHMEYYWQEDINNLLAEARGEDL